MNNTSILILLVVVSLLSVLSLEIADAACCDMPALCPNGAIDQTAADHSNPEIVNAGFHHDDDEDFIEWGDIDWWLIALIAVGVAGFVVFAIRAVVLNQRKKQPTGIDELIGATAKVKSPLTPKGIVATHGEIWEAILDKGQADAGEEVIITEVKGLQLRVTKKQIGGESK